MSWQRLLKKSEQPQIFKINHSEWMVKCLLALHLLPIPFIFLSSLSFNNQLLLIVSIFISLLVYLKREICFNSITISYSTIKGWEFGQVEDVFSSIQVLPSTVLTPYLLILHFKLQNNSKKTILICRDALIDDEYRKLLVLLKISGLKKVANEPK